VFTYVVLDFGVDWSAQKPSRKIFARIET